MTKMDEFFPDISRVDYEGKDSDSPLAFNYYDPERKIGNKAMKEHLRFSMAYWQTLTEDGSDPFGAGTMQRPWDSIEEPMELARARAAFEFMDKLGIGYFCFHDRDIAPRGDTLGETNENLDEIISLIRDLMAETGINLLWGTAKLTFEPKYVHGASSSPNADVFARAAAQVKKAMEITNELDGDNFVFWNGREGYETLLNTDMGLEQDNMARFFEMAIDHAKEINFDGQLLIEPKPKEPAKHQYDFDVPSVLAFLRKYGLEDHFKINVEANHATLAKHTFQHELHYARINDVLGSIDANRGDKLLGWDTDRFPTDLHAATLAMYEVLKNGGIKPGGLNFDAKVRRGSFEPIDLFYGHIAGMDTFARGLEVAYSLLESGELDDFVEERYSSYREGIGKDIVEGKVGFEDLEEYALKNDDITNPSGHQEMLESIINRYILET